MMDKHQHDAQPPSGRRKFLRQLGMTAAATAALSGIADVAGLKPAEAATRPRGVKKVRGVRESVTLDSAESATARSLYCYPAPGSCGEPCEPSGLYCHGCTAITEVSGETVSYAYNLCIGGDTTFTLT